MEEGVEVSGWNDTGYWEAPEQDPGSESHTDLASRLLELSLVEGVTLEAGYTNDGPRASAFLRNGIPSDRVFPLGPAAGTDGTVTLPDDDLRSLAVGVGTLVDRACEKK